jgi:hypothetical protein
LRVRSAGVEGVGLEDFFEGFCAIAGDEDDGVGMGFADVDEQELGAVFELLIELFYFARLATEGRSGEARKDEYDRPLAAEAR